MARMQIDEAYRLLELEAGATEEVVRRAWRDLTKVWHPDRFGNDPELREKAQEKLKSINEAYETILAARADGFESPTPKSDSPPRRRFSRHAPLAILCISAGIFILLRRPTPAGLILAALLFTFGALVLRMT